MNRKLIFLDIDGTFTLPGGLVPPDSAKEAVRRARANGHQVFLCSGRNYGMLAPLLQYGFDGAVASAGGYILCGDQVIYDCKMSQEQAERAFHVFQKNHVFCTVECLDAAYTDEKIIDYFRKHKDVKGGSELLRWREQIDKLPSIRPLSEYHGEPVYKIVFMCTNGGEDQLAEPKRELEAEFQFCMQDAGTWHGLVGGEIINRLFDKGRAVERVCKYLNIPLEDTFAFGDSMNDFEMIRTAGCGICMANGNAQLKMAADDICPSATEDGLYWAFEKYGLI